MNPQSIAVLAGFHIVLIAILGLDLGVFQKRAHIVGLKEAALWCIVWMTLALLFALAVTLGRRDGLAWNRALAAGAVIIAVTIVVIWLESHVH